MAAVAAVLAALAGGGLAVSAALGHGATMPACKVSSPSGTAFELDLSQGQNAAIIAAVGLKLGLPDHAVTVALATALQESDLHNLPSGDLDSVGLFQQRPSQGWGSPAQLQDPVYASTAFYGRLTQIPGWQSMAVTVAAQAVQHSAAPNAYAQWEDEARALAIALTGEAATAFTCQLDGFAGAAPPATALAGASANELGTTIAGQSFGTKAGWATAYWLVAHAWQYHVSEVTLSGWRWTASSGRWSSSGAGAGQAGIVSFR